MTRPRLQHVPVEQMPSRTARPGDRWRIIRAPLGRRISTVWLAGPVDLYVLATPRSKYLEFTKWEKALEYALRRYEGLPTTVELVAFERALHVALGLPGPR